MLRWWNKLVTVCQIPIWSYLFRFLRHIHQFQVKFMKGFWNGEGRRFNNIYRLPERSTNRLGMGFWNFWTPQMLFNTSILSSDWLEEWHVHLNLSEDPPTTKTWASSHDLCIHGVVGRQELANAKEALATELQQTSNGADDADAALRTAERRMRVTRQGLREQQEKMEEREANLMLGYFLGERKCVG